MHLMRRLGMYAGAWVIVFALSLAVAAAAQAVGPHLRFVLPKGSTVTARSVIDVSQTTTSFDPASVTSVVIEYAPSVPGDPQCQAASWTEIRTILGEDTDAEAFNPNRWTAYWDTDGVASGKYCLRATLSYASGAVSKIRRVKVNQPPVINTVTATDGASPGEVIFDASSVTDVDGQPVKWTWDFGDPSANAAATFVSAGRIATVHYNDLGQTYDVHVTVRDDKRAESSAYYTLAFAPLAALAANPNCICESIFVKVTGEGLGPKVWGASVYGRGKVLGPLDGNPRNKVKNGEKEDTGYAVEVGAIVKGDIKNCRETELIKSTLVLAGDETLHASYRGTGDRDLDGANDMNITDAVSCILAGGSPVMNPGPLSPICHFPQNGTQYKPNGYRGSVYDRPGIFKKYRGNGVVWINHSQFAGATGTTYKADKVAIIRGTDGKYCYVAFSFDCEKKVGADKESIAPAPNANGYINGTINANNVPNVP